VAPGSTNQTSKTKTPSSHILGTQLTPWLPLFCVLHLAQVFTLPYVRQHLQRFNSQERTRLLQRRASLKTTQGPAPAPAAAAATAVSEEDLTPRQRMELKKEQERQRRQLELQVRPSALLLCIINPRTSLIHGQGG
jgi:hypothetical protein